MSQWPGGQRPAQPYGQYPQHGAPPYRYQQPYPGGQQPHPGGVPPRPGNQPPKKRRAPLIIAILVVITAVVATGVAISSFNGKDDDGGLGSGTVTDPRKYGVNVAAGAVAQYATEVAGLPRPGPLTSESLGGVDPASSTGRC
jgi:hypothetical protein